MKTHRELEERHRTFISEQKMFFVGSAPLSCDGHVNVSPKGLDSFVVIDSRTVAYIDFGGSGIETHAHLLENGRLVVMFCAFEGQPLILRLYGRGRALAYGTEGFDALRSCFPTIDVPVRGIIALDITRVQDSCGWGVPLYEFKGQRDKLIEHNRQRTQEEHMERRYRSNDRSLDDLPGLTRP